MSNNKDVEEFRMRAKQSEAETGPLMKIFIFFAGIGFLMIVAAPIVFVLSFFFDFNFGRNERTTPAQVERAVEPASPPGRTSTAPPRTTAEFELREFHQTEIKNALHRTIRSTGHDCPSVSRVWGVIQRGNFQNIVRVRCSNGSEFQVTAIGDREFVRPWTGTLLGD